MTATEQARKDAVRQMENEALRQAWNDQCSYWATDWQGRSFLQDEIHARRAAGNWPYRKIEARGSKSCRWV